MTPPAQKKAHPSTGADQGRELDIVVYGATGFVGRLAARHLAEHAASGVRIGLAGRNATKLGQVRAELPERAVDWPLIEADADDVASLESMAARTKVVLTTVGPYARYGLPLVGACATAGTHYVDLTGETLFVRDSIDMFDETARRSGARIVHSCGFDSIPSDLGVWLTATTAKEAGVGDLTDTTLYVLSMRGGASGGTIASMVGQFDAIKKQPKLRAVVADPYALSPDRDAEPQPRHTREPQAAPTPLPVTVATSAAKILRGLSKSVTPGYSPQTGKWTAPFVMGPFNSQVVRRSNALQGWGYGRSFHYRELVTTGRGAKAPVSAALLTAAMPAAFLGLGFAPTRALLDRLLPAAGEGPSTEARAAGRFIMAIHAVTTGGARYVTKVAADADPGYDGTAVMIGQAALALAAGDPGLPETAGGVLTPATALGGALVERLRACGFTFDVERVD